MNHAGGGSRSNAASPLPPNAVASGNAVNVRSGPSAQSAYAFGKLRSGDVVRVLTMTKDSVELCGGTHVHRTGDIGLFKVVSEGAVAAGVRRIEALTGEAARRYLVEREAALLDVAAHPDDAICSMSFRPHALKIRFVIEISRTGRSGSALKC